MNERRTVKAFSPEDMARRRKRSVIMAIILGAMMLIFFVTTIVRMGSSVLERTM